MKKYIKVIAVFILCSLFSTLYSVACGTEWIANKAKRLNHKGAHRIGSF